jgi:multisubunit Na+/H+ antiporter MnhE subunit
MLLLVVVMLVIFMAIEKVIDGSSENRIINPILGVVLTLLLSSFFVRMHGGDAHPSHLLHIFLYIACILYVRAMIDSVFVFFLFS